MKLLVIRHGPAGDPEAWKAEGRDDRLRPLSPEGKKDMRQAAAGLATLISKVDVIITSPLLRATQTAEIVAGEYDCEMIIRDALLPDKEPEETLASIEERQEDQIVALVGHEPHLSTFVTYLLSGERASFVDLKKGGACLLELEGLSAGRPNLKWLLTRRELARLAE